MRIVFWQTILMKYHTLFFRKLGKMLQNLSSSAVVIGALRVKLRKGGRPIQIAHEGAVWSGPSETLQKSNT